MTGDRARPGDDDHEYNDEKEDNDKDDANDNQVENNDNDGKDDDNYDEDYFDDDEDENYEDNDKDLFINMSKKREDPAPLPPLYQPLPAFARPQLVVPILCSRRPLKMIIKLIVIMHSLLAVSTLDI